MSTQMTGMLVFGFVVEYFFSYWYNRMRRKRTLSDKLQPLTYVK